MAAGSDLLLTAEELRGVAAGLRRMVAAVEAGDLTATATERAYLVAAVATLEQLLPPTS